MQCWTGGWKLMGIAVSTSILRRQLNDQQHFRISFEISTCIFMYVNKFGGSCPQSAKVRSAQLGEKSSKDFHSDAGGWWHLPRDQIRLDSLRACPGYGFYISTQDRTNRNSGKCNNEHHSWYFYKDLLLLQGPNSFIPDMILIHRQKAGSTWETLTHLPLHIRGHATLSPSCIYSLTFKCRFPDVIWFSFILINMDLTRQSMDEFRWKKHRTTSSWLWPLTGNKFWWILEN